MRAARSAGLWWRSVPIPAAFALSACLGGKTPWLLSAQLRPLASCQGLPSSPRSGRLCGATSRGQAARRSAATVVHTSVRSTPAPMHSPNAGTASGAVHVLTCATEYRQETAILQRSATRNGFAVHVVGIGEPWGGFSTKFLAYYNALQQLIGTDIRPDDTVLLMDAWDTVILGSADELLEKIEDLPDDAVLCGAERVCGPNHFLVGQMEQLFPDGQTPWRYPNSGGLVASAETMVSLLHGLIYETEDGHQLDASENDQVRLHDFLISRTATGRPFPFQLDTGCRVFQCMYEETPQWNVISNSNGPRIMNRLTRERPVIAHGNGHTGRWFLSALYSEMKLLQHLGLTMEELAHLPHEMPVAPGTVVTEEVKAEYCPWWYMPGMHKGATDGFATFYMIREMQCGGK